MKRNVLKLYVFSLIGFTLIVLYFLKSGKGLEHAVSTLPVKSIPVESHMHKVVADSINPPLAIFILQIILIIAVSQVCAFLFKKIGQPSVIGEIVAGILLGPSLLGTILPQFSSFIFPVASLGNLQMLSQIGLILFMFVIGMELDMTVLKQKVSAALLISYFGIIVPFSFGIVLSYFLYSRFTPANIPFYAFALFIGIAMSITAFPVLARIIRERGLSNTRFGTIAITAAAAGDLAAWCILAIIIAIVRAGSLVSSLYTLVAVGVYVCVMLFIISPMIKRLALKGNNNKTMKRSVMAFFVVILLLSSYCCEVIGIHALFGAFLAGVIMPDEWDFRKLLIDKIEDVALVLLLPLFFVVTGLKTQVGLLSDPSLWLTCLLIVFVAVVSKFGGSFIAARFAGENMQDSLSIGALMNTRGLVELVVLNIGYDLQIISPQMFTMMVLMALITTYMTSPAINFINKIYEIKNI